MAIVDPSSAVIAKVKSKYGKRLREKDYRAIVKCGSVGEVVQYLKTYTHYRTYLDKVSADVHRGNLENIMREKQFENLLTFCKYNAGDSPVTAYLMRSTELHELMKFITYLSIGRPREYLFSTPMYFVRHKDIRLEDLASVNDHQGLLDVVDNADFRAVLERFPPEEDGDYDLAAIEDALENDNLSELYRDIGKIKNKKDRAELTELFDTLSDLHNFSRIIRLKKYYRMNNDELRSHLIERGRLTGKRLDKILQKEDYDEIIAALRQTTVAKRSGTNEADSDTAVRGRYELCRRKLYFSTNPEIVLLAYHIVSGNELSNVITVIEGVRYGMAPDKIYQNLIL